MFKTLNRAKAGHSQLHRSPGCSVARLAPGKDAGIQQVTAEAEQYGDKDESKPAVIPDTGRRQAHGSADSKKDYTQNDFGDF